MSPSEFDKQSYWSARFANEASFEWLLSSEAFLGLIRPHIARLDKATARILHLGFGTSDLQLHLRAAGFGGMHADAETDCADAHGDEEEDAHSNNCNYNYDSEASADSSSPADSGGRYIISGSSSNNGHDKGRRRRAVGGGGAGAGAAVVNVDFAPEACERGRRQEHAAFGNVRMRYVVADATRLDAAALGGPFDLVLDKSTADAVSCAGDAAVRALVRSVRGCLKPDGGVWISLSYAASRFDPVVLVEEEEAEEEEETETEKKRKRRKQQQQQADHADAAGGESESPVRVKVLARVPTAKKRESDPDIFHWCYLLS